jgi:hypothetical protein
VAKLANLALDGKRRFPEHRCYRRDRAQSIIQEVIASNPKAVED